MVEQSKVGCFIPQDRRDISAEAIGTKEHHGRVSGLEKGVGFKSYFWPSKSCRQVNYKREIEEIADVQVRGGKGELDSGGDDEFAIAGSEGCLEGARGER